MELGEIRVCAGKIGQRENLLEAQAVKLPQIVRRKVVVALFESGYQVAASDLGQKIRR